MPLPVQKHRPSTRIAMHLLAFRRLNRGQALFSHQAVDIKHGHLSFKHETVIKHPQAQVRIIGEVRGPCCMHDASRVASDTPNSWGSVTLWHMHEARSLLTLWSHDRCVIGRGRVASPLHSNNILTPYPSLQTLSCRNSNHSEIFRVVCHDLLMPKGCSLIRLLTHHHSWTWVSPQATNAC